MCQVCLGWKECSIVNCKQIHIPTVEWWQLLEAESYLSILLVMTLRKVSGRGSLALLAKYWGFGSGEPISARLWPWKMWGDLYLAKSRSASLDMVMFVRFCCRTNMFRHIFLIPDSLILLKYCAPFIRIQEIRCPRPSVRERKTVQWVSQNNTTE